MPGRGPGARQGEAGLPIFAVDSASTVTPQVWDDVRQAAGTAPSAWFRYIGGRYAATAAEVAFLHAQGCAVGLIYNAATASQVAGGHAQGEADAEQAAAAAHALGAPSTLMLFVDVESAWQPSAAWIEGWADGQRAGPFAGAGAYYCNPRSTGFRHAFSCARACSANVAAAPLWSAVPEPGATTAAAAPPWRPATVDGQPVVAWQYAESAYGGIVDLDLVEDGFTGLWRPAADPRFTDVPTSAAFAPAVAGAIQAGLMDGVAGGRFAPAAIASRADLAAVAARLARRAGWIP